MGCGLSKPQGPAQAVALSAPQAAPQAGSQHQDVFSQGLGDAQQAVGLIDGVYKLVEPAILEANHRRNERNSLKKFLGPWWNEAFEHGACMVPVLDIEDFERHLQRTDGVLTPIGNCTAESPWGYLLHALAINPGDKTLTWKPASGESWDMPTGALAMDVRGVSFSHLINLYSLDPPEKEEFEIEGKRRERGSCQLTFGWLSWTSTDSGHMIAKFEPDTIPKLNSQKKPLRGLELLTVDPQPRAKLLWTAYQSALRYGISDPKLQWPKPGKASFSERLQCLVNNMVALSNGEPRILTRTWLESASRIKVRAMTNGGKDDTFLKDAYKALALHPRRVLMTQGEHTMAVDALKDCFFFQDEKFAITNEPYVTGTEGVPFGPDANPSPYLEAALNLYSEENPKSWKGQLYSARELVLRVALMKKERRIIVGDEESEGVRIIDYTSKDPLWRARVHL
jgi:hypothetical protein